MSERKALRQFTLPSGVTVAVTRGNHPDYAGGMSIGRDTFWLDVGGVWHRLPARSQHKAKELVEAMIEVAGLEPDGIYEAPEEEK